MKAGDHEGKTHVHGDVTVVCVLVMTPVTLFGAVNVAFSEPLETAPLNR